MKHLSVYIEVSGSRIQAGSISGNSPDDAVFRYEPAYLEASGSRPVSISLPLQREAFSLMLKGQVQQPNW